MDILLLMGCGMGSIYPAEGIVALALRRMALVSPQDSADSPNNS